MSVTANYVILRRLAAINFIQLAYQRLTTNLSFICLIYSRQIFIYMEKSTVICFHSYHFPEADKKALRGGHADAIILSGQCTCTCAACPRTTRGAADSDYLRIATLDVQTFSCFMPGQAHFRLDCPLTPFLNRKLVFLPEFACTPRSATLLWQFETDV